jgi:hypothetical protein
MSEPITQIILPDEAPTPLIGFHAKQLFSRVKMGALWKRRHELDEGQVAILKSLYDNKSKGTLLCRTPMTYDLRRTGVSKLGYGRVYGSKGSLETLQRDIRATLCAEYYDDVDMINAHPVLAVQMAKRWFNHDMPNLQRYCENRKKMIQTWVNTYGITEQDAKEIPIRLLNNGSLTKSFTTEEPGFRSMPALNPSLEADNEIEELQKECRGFVKMIVLSKRHDELYQWCRTNKTNYLGSFISALLQTEERKCLTSIVSTLRSKGYSVDVLAYDGCMVRKDKSKPLHDGVLRDCERAVEKMTGYSIALKIKPMEDDVIPLEELESVSEFDDGYSEMKEQWEENHYYFRPTGTIVENTSDGGTIHFKLEHATEAFNMWKLKKVADKEDDSFLKRWRQDPSRRIVDNIVMKMPEDCESHEASCFGGFAYKRVQADVDDDTRQKYIGIFKEIMMNLFGDQEDVMETMIKLFAHRIQKPFERPNVCVILRSNRHGAGKDTLIGIVRRMIGDRATAHYTSDDLFWDKHDTMKQGALMIHLEEAGLSNRKMADQLKARITSESNLIRPCGVGAYNVPNVALYLFSTNRALPITLESSDRRFFLINCEGRPFATKEECSEYWEPIYECIQKGEFLQVIGEWLEQQDLIGFVPSNFPDTEYKKAMLETVMTSEEQFLEQWESNEGGDTLTDLYNKYRSYCMENSLPYRMTPNGFSQTIVPFKKYYRKVRSQSNGKDIALYVKP